ncbi:L,D-transpeptidase catalytic domain protein [Leptospira bouyouniensis]|uniref:L,D-transpeptidase catalytic domain protein n=1 Tax=Leptospira bouyouniensis TaxID=2484911 RepID=A0ABY2L3Y7_9LEPT|nr:L,D-transpeptidase catalytic domain protein [Leptospira bouyouniensis]
MGRWFEPSRGSGLVIGHLESSKLRKFFSFSLKISTIFPTSFLYFSKKSLIAYTILCLIPFFAVSFANSLPNSSKTPIFSQSEQIILILGKPGNTQGKLYFFAADGGEWKEIVSRVPVWFGRSGLISADKKREGDGFTPSGSFPVKRVFGYTRRSMRNLEYTQIRRKDHWSDASNSKHYNQFIRNYEKGATSLWNSPIYQLFIAIEHNTNPSIPGYGSMIFLHPWDETKPTSGCVGLKFSDLETIIQNLNGNKNPFILIVESEEEI